MCGKELRLSLQAIRVRNIVRIHSGYVPATSELQSPIKRLDEPLSRPVQHAKPFVAARQRVEYRAATVGRSIVEDQEFKVLERLLEDALHGRLEIRQPVMD